MNATRFGLLLTSAVMLVACVPQGSNSSTPASPSPQSSDSGSAASPPMATSTPSATASPDAVLEAGDVVADEELLHVPPIHEGKQNVVEASTRKDGRLEVRTNLQFNRIVGDTVTPVNEATATASCAGCQAVAVAVQINVYERGAPIIAPRNTARAVNEQCDQCTTIARAIQYVIPVDDVDLLPKDVDELVREINKEAHSFDKLKDAGQIDAQQVQARLQAVMAKFAQLDEYLSEAMDQAQPATASTP